MKICLLALLFVVSSSQCWGWGTKGHETVETAAVKLLPESNLSKVLKTNIKAVRFLSMAPDLSWKHGEHPHHLEGEAHFFNFDFYSPRGGPLHPDINFYIDREGDPKAIVKAGTAPWRIEQITAVMVQVLKQPRVSEKQVVQIASALGHYVGDLGNPLHVAADYDGVGIGRPGLHKFFETETVESMPTQDLVVAVARAAGGILERMPDQVSVIGTSFTLAMAANENTKVVLADAKRLGLTPALQTKFKPIIINSMALSAAVLAKLWNAAYVAAGSPTIATSDLGQIPVPEWVPITYIRGVKPE